MCYFVIFMAMRAICIKFWVFWIVYFAVIFLSVPIPRLLEFYFGLFCYALTISTKTKKWTNIEILKLPFVIDSCFDVHVSKSEKFTDDRDTNIRNLNLVVRGCLFQMWSTYNTIFKSRVNEVNDIFSTLFSPQSQVGTLIEQS